jgi:hypothetical protein
LIAPAASASALKGEAQDPYGAVSGAATVRPQIAAPAMKQQK